MKLRIFPVIILLLLPAASVAAAQDHMDHHSDKSRYPADYEEITTSPEPGEGIQKYAPDDDDGPHSNFGRTPVHDNELFYTVMIDRLEYQSREGDPALVWDGSAWIGNDYDKLIVESEGEYLLDKEDYEEVEVEAYYGRTISRFWTAKAGIRHDYEPQPERTFAAFGVEGLAPYWFETEITGYLSNHGNFQAKLEVEYDLLLTQRLILQPRFEAMVSAQDVDRYGEADGINDFSLGARLRYEIVREFAPYVGVTWKKKTGEAGTIARLEGEETSWVSFVAGLRAWY